MTIALPNGPKTVKARVLEMTDPETFDLLVGFSFLLQENASLYNNTSLSDPPKYGVMFPGGTIVPYKSAWDPSTAEVQAFRVRSIRASGTDAQEAGKHPRSAFLIRSPLFFL